MKMQIRQISISILFIVFPLGLSQPARAIDAEQAVKLIEVWDTYYRGLQQIFRPRTPESQPDYQPPASTPEYSQPDYQPSSSPDDPQPEVPTGTEAFTNN
jgi:hypothetical protein